MSRGGGVERASSALSRLGADSPVRSLPGSTRSAADAAAALGCAIANIAKSLVFRRTGSDYPVMIVMSGSNRVDPEKVAAVLGEPVEMADARYVRDKTGYAIGGVAPVGHRVPMTVLLDEDLFSLGFVWAAAGSPNSVFRIEPGELLRITGGQRVAIAR